MKRTLATCVAPLALASSVFAAERTLPTPPPSDYADTENSANVQIVDWLPHGRNVKLRFTAYVTPTNNIQVDLGQDLNANGILEPHETALTLGIDCGVPFIREEINPGKWRSGVLAASEEDPNLDCSPSTFTFTLKQPLDQAARLTFAKVTTRGRDDNSAAQIAAEITRPGTALILR